MPPITKLYTNFLSLRPYLRWGGAAERTVRAIRPIRIGIRRTIHRDNRVVGDQWNGNRVKATRGLQIPVSLGGCASALIAQLLWILKEEFFGRSAGIVHFGGLYEPGD